MALKKKKDVNSSILTMDNCLIHVYYLRLIASYFPLSRVNMAIEGLHIGVKQLTSLSVVLPSPSI